MASAEESNSIPFFNDVLASRGCQGLVRTGTKTLQINLGRVCNQSCSHCHADAGPTATDKMSQAVMQRSLVVLAASPGVSTVDITGGAPELHSSFRKLVAEIHQLGCHIIDRCNLTVLTEPGMEGLPEFLADHNVDIFASLPCYTESNVEIQRGPGSFSKSIRAIRLLNALGYGKQQPRLQLNLVYNPLGPFLPTDQGMLEDDYRRRLREQFGIVFNRLLTITNMPIGRFESRLQKSKHFESYMELLVSHFNPMNLPKLMCQSSISVGCDGMLYDCDFNQMLRIQIAGGGDSVWTIRSFDELEGGAIVTGRHCFGCTAGNGSSCGGSLQ
jgi:radical SAM/Cys-rich protein